MEKDNLEKITHLHQTQFFKEVNTYISEGWILLNIHTTDSGHPVERDQHTVFTLGWDSDKGEVKLPEYNF
ncbi:hypothetical protein BK125_31035 [Paenibacillus odorifer]|uniref:Uncharacterized protein n=1 Tax=Paenibacillus odorifer TaxID=189426 RepID=A0ABX3GFT9_9BACL|nr:hypothetical protein [Paenibacillus odorifer]OMC63269.1 hypothetical protein BK125_31035 [Paenibacillus odorifer]OMD14803.1 hypothetical protein BSO21_27645 [Paenibacillus odorifer]